MDTEKRLKKVENGVAGGGGVLEVYSVLNCRECLLIWEPKEKWDKRGGR